MAEQELDRFCSQCGQMLDDDQMFCPRCGTARAAGQGSSAVDEPSAIDQTIMRGAFKGLAQQQPMAETVVGQAPVPPAPVTTVMPAVAPTAPMNDLYGSIPRGPMPAVVGLVAVLLVAVAGLLLYPVFRWGGPVIEAPFHGGVLGFSVGMLGVYSILVLVMLASALVGLAAGLCRGSRVSHALAIILAGSIAIGEAVQFSEHVPLMGPRWADYVIIGICLAVIGALLLPPSQAFFAVRDATPLGVGIARAICVYFGWSIATGSIVIMMLGGIEQQFIYWGAGLFVVAVLLLVGQALVLHDGPGGAILATCMLVSYVGLIVALCAVMGDIPRDAGMVVGLVLAVTGVGAFWIPQSSRAFYASPVGTRPPMRHAVLASTLALVLLLALGIGGCVVGSIAASKADSFDMFSSSDLPQDDPSSYPTETPSDPVTEEPTPTEVTESDLVNSWTASAVADEGYTEDITIATGEPMHYVPGTTFGDATAGGACDIDPDTDAIVPLEVTLTNTSDIDAPLAFTLGFGPDWSEPEADMHLNVSGDVCRTESFLVRWDARSPGTSVSSQEFLILKDYYTDEFPDGDPSVLANATIGLEQANYQNSSTGDSYTYAPSEVQGDGVDPDNPYFSIGGEQ